MKKEVDIKVELIDGNNDKSITTYFNEWYDMVERQSKESITYTHTHNGVEYEIEIEGLKSIEFVKVVDDEH